MYKLLFLSLFFTSLYAINPKAYASLGDTIYNNLQGIKKLTSISDCYLYVDDIKRYIVDVNAVKKEGFLLNANSSPKEGQAYLRKLRNLASVYDKYVRVSEKLFNNSIENGDTLLFTKILNTGLIDLNEHKNEILKYYSRHKNEINASGVLKEFLVKSMKSTKKNQIEVKRESAKMLHEAQKIKRLRERDKKYQVALEKRLDNIVKKKKKEIRKKERAELINSL